MSAPEPMSVDEARALVDSLQPMAHAVAETVGDSPEAWRGVVLTLMMIHHAGDLVRAAHPGDTLEVMLAIINALANEVPK